MNSHSEELAHANGKSDVYSVPKPRELQAASGLETNARVPAQRAAVFGGGDKFAVIKAAAPIQVSELRSSYSNSRGDSELPVARQPH